MIILPSVLTGIIVITLLVRLAVVWYVRFAWKKICTQYILFNPSVENIDSFESFTKMTPSYLMILEIWHWNFRRYIHNQDKMKEIMEYFRKF